MYGEVRLKVFILSTRFKGKNLRLTDHSTAVCSGVTHNMAPELKHQPYQKCSSPGPTQSESLRVRSRNT